MLTPPHQTYFWGVVICILATALCSLGLVLQKLSHTYNEQIKQPVVYYRQPLWRVGFTLFILAQALNLVPMATTPQVLLSCIGTTALIFNAILAWMLLHEELHLLEVAAMLGVVCGVVMVVLTIPATQAVTNPSLISILDPLFTVRFLVTGILLFLSLLVSRLAVDGSSLLAQWPDLDPLVWTLCSAVAGGYCVNLCKAMAQLCAVWSEAQPQLQWKCYAILLTAILLGVFHVHSLNRALNLGSAMMVVPTYCALGLLTQMVVAEMIFVCLPRTIGHILVFAGGIVMILVFIVLFARTKIAYEEEPDAELEDVIGKTLPLTKWKRMSSGDFDPDEGLPLTEKSFAATRSMSALDPARFKESRGPGLQRTYTVSVIGFGIA